MGAYDVGVVLLGDRVKVEMMLGWIGRTRACMSVRYARRRRETRRVGAIAKKMLGVWNFFAKESCAGIAVTHRW